MAVRLQRLLLSLLPLVRLAQHPLKATGMPMRPIGLPTATTSIPRSSRSGRPSKPSNTRSTMRRQAILRALLVPLRLLGLRRHHLRRAQHLRRMSLARRLRRLRDEFGESVLRKVGI
ncbi:hypothetical protein BD414DRAFT_486858 [Trametes punicea]|nr:hypothetical protein BD414DRAFT_486858 [Trametes punicea]